MDAKCTDLKTWLDEYFRDTTQLVYLKPFRSKLKYISLMVPLSQGIDIFDTNDDIYFEDWDISIVQAKILTTFLSEVLYNLLADNLLLQVPNSLRLAYRNARRKFINSFIHQTIRCAACDPKCLVIALMYFESFVRKTNKEINHDNYKVFFIACTIISSKMWEDRFVKNHTFQKLYHHLWVELSTLNQAEKEVLKTLEFNLFITNDEFEEYIEDRSELLSSLLQRAQCGQILDLTRTIFV